MSSSESITVSHVPPHKSRGCDSVIPPTLDTDDSSEPPDECWTSEESQDEYSPTKSDICSDDSASEVDATMGNSDDDLLHEFDATKLLPKQKSAVQGSTGKSITHRKASSKTSRCDHVTSGGSGRSSASEVVGVPAEENWKDADSPLSVPIVPAVVKKSDGKRVHNKTQYCMFCEKQVKMFARHIERHHQNSTCQGQGFELPKKIKGKKETARPVKGEFQTKTHAPLIDPFCHINLPGRRHFCQSCLYIHTGRTP